jgi:hypothetical protein
MQKLGKNTQIRVAGRHTLQDITSDNGEKLVLATALNLESSTKFLQRRIHRGTWKVLDRTSVIK